MTDSGPHYRDQFEPTRSIDRADAQTSPARSEPTRPIRPVELDPSLERFDPTQPIDLAETRAALARPEPARPVELLDDLFTPPQPIVVVEPREPRAVARPEPTRPIDLMDQLDLDPRDEAPAAELPEIRTPSDRGALITALVVAALVLGAGAWLLLRRPPLPPAAAPASSASATSNRAPTMAEAPPAVPPVPPLGASDPFVRELVAQLGAHPDLARWLAGEELARRFVATVLNVAEGTSPASHWRELTPAKPFDARASRGRWYVTPETFRRYDRITEVVDSLDPQAAAALFRNLHPLFDLAYAEIGNPASTFDAELERALGNLVRVQIPDAPVEVRPQGVGFAFADHGLEQLTVAEKHLLRFGPENARRVQTKLALLAAACGLEPH